MNFARILSLVVLSAVSLPIASAVPTISGVNAFWWLGSGITSNGGSCSGQSGPCYYSQAAWTVNPNGAMGSIVWTVTNPSGTGALTLDCYTCTNVVATATAPSTGCVYDVQVTVSVGGVSSAVFYVLINTATTPSLRGGYPADSIYPPPSGIGYLSETQWDQKDSCGYAIGGFDINEDMGAYTDDTSNNWTEPIPGWIYLSSTVPYDYQAAFDNTFSPSVQNPSGGSTKIFYYYPWHLNIFSSTPGNGVTVRSDTHQYYRDHGRHD